MTQSVESEDVQIREYFRKREETATDRFNRQLRVFLRGVWKVVRHAMLLVPLLVTCILLLDLPLRLYDGIAGGQDNISPSNWLSWGEGLLVLSLFILICIARCHGAEFASRVMSVAWLMAAAFVAGLLFYLAPQLAPGDLPGTRFMLAFFGSWYFGQLIAVHVYDITRGGRWWRAPFYGLVFGFGVQCAFYFPAVYMGVGEMHNVPWVSWMIIDFWIKALLALAFLPVYRMLKRSLRPVMGLGGY